MSLMAELISMMYNEPIHSGGPSHNKVPCFIIINSPKVDIFVYEENEHGKISIWRDHRFGEVVDFDLRDPNFDPEKFIRDLVR